MLHIRISLVREAQPAAPRAPESHRPSWRRRVAMASVTAMSAIALVSVAGAAPTTDTTAVDFVAIPAKTVMGSNSIPAGKTESAVVIDGSTTVPSNATTVQIQATVKGTANGTISFFPAGNEAGGAGHTLSWNAGQTVTGITAENVGMSNKVSVKNLSAKAAVVTLKLIGYSTQVTAGGINGSGGSPGQVLTNTGAGATWQTPSTAHGLNNAAYVALAPSSLTQVAALTVPAGSYAVSYAGDFYNQNSSDQLVFCKMNSPSGSQMTANYGSASTGLDESLAMQGLLKTSGGTIRVLCQPSAVNAFIGYNTLQAVQVGAVAGNFTTGSTSGIGSQSPLRPTPSQ